MHARHPAARKVHRARRAASSTPHRSFMGRGSILGMVLGGMALAVLGGMSRSHWGARPKFLKF